MTKHGLEPLITPDWNQTENTMRASRYLIATQKETPADAEIISHQFMLRAGMIRKLAAGLYTWLPMGLRTLRKVERIVREEMDKSGGPEAPDAGRAAVRALAGIRPLDSIRR